MKSGQIAGARNVVIFNTKRVSEVRKVTSANGRVRDDEPGTPTTTATIATRALLAPKALTKLGGERQGGDGLLLALVAAPFHFAAHCGGGWGPWLCSLFPFSCMLCWGHVLLGLFHGAQEKENCSC